MFGDDSDYDADTADAEWREAILAARAEYEQEGDETPRGSLDRRGVVGLSGSGCEARPPLNIEELAASIRAHHEILQAKRVMVDPLDYLLNLVHDEIIVGSGNILEVLGMLPYYRVVPQIGAQVNILIFIVIIIGGLGSTFGCLVGALLVGLMANYTGFVAPKVALFSNIGLMVAVLLWRPQGLYPVANR